MTPDELETLIEALPASLVVEAAVLRAALVTLRRAEAREAERAADEALLRELMVAYRQMGTEEARHDLLSIARALAR